jgi:hypothetical protein
LAGALAGSEVLPIVQSGATVKVANNDLRPKQIQSNATTGVLQVAGPTAGATRVMTTPDANFTVARTDAAQTFTGIQTLGVAVKAGTYTAGATTPSVTGVSFLSIANSSATSITNFTGGVEGQILVLLFQDSNTTITRDNAYLSGGVNFTSTASDTLTLIYSSPYWYEVARSVNS